MVSEAIEVTYDKMRRFLTPVISDHNNNLLAHFSYNKAEQLETLLSMPGF